MKEEERKISPGLEHKRTLIISHQNKKKEGEHIALFYHHISFIVMPSFVDTDNNETSNGNIESLREPLLSVDLDSVGDVVIQNDNDATVLSQTKIKPKSKNINLILFYTFITFCSRSLWNQSVLSAFVYLLQTDDPKYVGFVTAIMGLAQLLSSFPAGYLADKYRRDTMLRISSVIGFIAATSTAIAAYVEQFWVLTFALALWGVFWGISYTSVSAMFADSIPDGDRSAYFTQRQITQLLGNTVGPTVAYVMFTTLGDVWTKQECAKVMQAGQILSIPALLLLHFIKDDYCMKKTDEENQPCDEEDPTTTESERDDMLTSDDEVEDTPLILHNAELSTSPSSPQTQNSSFLCIPGRRIVPVFVVTADVLGGLAAGMSVRYFPIFFLENLKMRPDQVQIIFIVTMLSMAITSRFVQWVSTKIGRLQITLLMKYSGVSMLFAMIHTFNQGRSYKVICVLFILRTSLMNGPGALTRSVVMDHVPTEERAKWSSLESVNMFSWAGSAALGGILVDMKGILFNFKTTALCQLIATIPLILALTFGSVKNENDLGHGNENEFEDDAIIDTDNNSSSDNSDGSNTNREATVRIISV